MGRVVGGGGQEQKKQEDQVGSYDSVQVRENQGTDRKSRKKVVRSSQISITNYKYHKYL